MAISVVRFWAGARVFVCEFLILKSRLESLELPREAIEF